MPEVSCVGCNGSGQIHRGYDGRRIRCPECMGKGMVSEAYANRPGGPGDASSRMPHSRGGNRGYRGDRMHVGQGAGRRGRQGAESSNRRIPAEICERRSAAERRYTGRSGNWLRLRVSQLFRGARRRGRMGRVSAGDSSWRWFHWGLIWIGLLVAVLAVGEISGFIESRTWPWGFQWPGWLTDLVPMSSF